MEANQATRTLSALSQPARLELVRWLMSRYPESVAAGEIAREQAMAPATLSFHLGKLEQAGLVEQQRASRHRLYRVRPDTMQSLMNFLFRDCCNGNPAACPDLMAGMPACTPSSPNSDA